MRWNDVTQYPDDEHIAVILLICEDMLRNADERELATRTIDEFLVPCLARSRELVQVLDELMIQVSESAYLVLNYFTVSWDYRAECRACFQGSIEMGTWC